MDNNDWFVKANRDLPERSAQAGAMVARSPQDDPEDADPADADLIVACEYFDDFVTLPGRYGLLMDVDYESSKIGACTVPYYKEFLRSEPGLQKRLEDYDNAQTDEERYTRGLHLFHSLLALADPGIAKIILADYELGAILADYKREGVLAEPSIIERIRQLGTGLANNVRERSGQLARIPSYADRALASVYSLLNPVFVPVPVAAGGRVAPAELQDGPNRASVPPTVRGGTGEPGNPTLTISETSTKLELWIYLELDWSDPRLGTSDRVHATLTTSKPAPSDLPWALSATWVSDQIWTATLDRGQEEAEIHLLNAEPDEPFTVAQVLAAQEWAQSLRVHISAEE